MSALFDSTLEQVRRQFLNPTQNSQGDARIVSAIEISVRLLLSQRGSDARWAGESLDRSLQMSAELPASGSGLGAIAEELVARFGGLPVWSDGRNQANIDPPPAIAGVLATLLSAMTNANLCSAESGGGVLEIEREVVATLAKLVGYDATCADGVFTFGGVGGLLYGVRAGLEAALPGHAQTGLRDRPVILTSDAAHHGVLSVASWLGIGEGNVVRVSCDRAFAMDVEALHEAAWQALAAKRPIAAIVATLGTTDAFGLDNLRAIDDVRKLLAREFDLAAPPHLHADAVAAWAWTIFNQYDFDRNPLQFDPRVVHALKEVRSATLGLRRCDSIGIDFHKTGYAPYTSSLVLFREHNTLQRLERTPDDMPYFQESGEECPGKHTLETSRSGAGPLSAFACLRALGAEGFQTLLGHAVSMSLLLREHLAEESEIAILNPDNLGPCTLFRVYPAGSDAKWMIESEQNDSAFGDRVEAHNAFNEAILRRILASAAESVTLSMTRCARRSASGAPITALKSYMLSPYTDAATMRLVFDQVMDAKGAVEREQQSVARA